jgi:hypothetical protein
MSEVKIKADTKQIDRLGAQFAAGAVIGLRRVLERGEQILRKEVPKATHNLMQGVSSEVDPSAMRATLVVSARSGRRGPRKATLHLPSGKTKQIMLRPQPAFDYAEAVARGTGIYGPKGKVITPKAGKGLLIPISGRPTGGTKKQSYIESGGQYFIVRPSMKGIKPDKFDERTADQLEREAPAIFDRALRDFAGGEK